MKLKLLLPFLLWCSLFSVVLSCSTVNKVAKEITVRSGEIPPDMKKENFVLLGILRGNKYYDRCLQQNFANYTGEYKLCTREELESTYKDKAAYRYIMDYTVGMSNSAGNGKGMLLKGYRFYILDRATNIKYKRLSRSSFKNLEIKVYLKAMETARGKARDVRH